MTIDDLREAADISFIINNLSRHDGVAASAALTAIAARAFRGRFTDVLTGPTVLDEDNIRDLMKGFLSLCEARQYVPRGTEIEHFDAIY